MANLSVRGVAEESLLRIKQTAKRRGLSVNRLITDMLNAEAGLAPAAKPFAIHHDLDNTDPAHDRLGSRFFFGSSKSKHEHKARIRTPDMLHAHDMIAQLELSGLVPMRMAGQLR